MAVLITEGRTVFKIGDVVTPKCPAGLWLSDRAPSGAYIDPRGDACIFTGRGTVTAVSTCVIDYDEWDREAGLLGHDATISAGLNTPATSSSATPVWAGLAKVLLSLLI